MEIFSAPVTLWRLRRDGQSAHAEVIPRMPPTLLVWIDHQLIEGTDFVEFSGALERADVVRDRLRREGWIDAD